MKHQVVVDARLIHTGHGSYIRNLLSGIHSERDRVGLHAIAQTKDLDAIRPHCDTLTVDESPIYSIREQFAIPWKSRGADLLHVPHYNAPLLYRGKLAVSILDLIHITFPTYSTSWGARLYSHPLLMRVVRKADHIFTLSEYSKNEIVNRLGGDPSKITVAYCGVGEGFREMDRQKSFERVSAELGIERPYVLFVGNLKPHKNVPTLLQACALMRERGRLDHQLVIVGDDNRWKEGLLQEARKLGLGPHLVHVPWISDELLPHVYAGADVLVLPSFLEGFGLPIVEAMACGTPVICARAGSIPEVAGGAALLFDPSSPEDLADKIEQVLSSRSVAEELRRGGFVRAKQFSWKRMALLHLDIYNQLLASI